MASSKAFYMLVSLLLVLVLADMDKALGEQSQLRNRKLIPFARTIGDFAFKIKPGGVSKFIKKGLDGVGAIPPGPPSPACNDDVCKRKINKQIKQILIKQKSYFLEIACKPNDYVCKRKWNKQINIILKKACKPNDDVCQLNLIKQINEHFLKKAKSPPSP